MSRRKQLLDDLEAAKAKLSKDSSCHLSDFRFEDETLYFVYDNGEQKENFMFHLTDYPDGTNMLFAASSTDPRMCTGSLFSVLKNLSNEYNVLHTPKKKTGKEEEEDGDEEEEGEEGEEGDYEEGEEEDDDMSGEGWEEEYATEMSYSEHPELTIEVENYAKIFGKENINSRPMPLLETVEVELNIVYHDILDVGVCAAWGIDAQKPIILRVTFSMDYFLDAKDEPKVEFYQERNGKKSFRLRYQLESILVKFIKEKWPANSGKKIKAKSYSNPLKRSGRRKLASSGGKGKEKDAKEKDGWLGKIFGDGKKGKEAAPVKKTEMDANLSALVDMGFSIEMAKNALAMAKSLEEATNLLLTDPDSCKIEEMPAAPASRVDELFASPEKALTEKNKVVEVSPDYGFMTMMAQYLRKRIPSLNNFCVICDQPHVFAHGNMLKPAVCSRELCCFSFQQMGVGADAADDIATGAEVVDLLVCFATVAAKSPRNQLIFEPYPLIFDSKDPKKVILSPQEKDFTKVNAILSRFPSVEKMSQAKDFADMKQQMDKAHESAFNFLQWIITSNRSHIVKMDESKQIKSMVTTHQYLLLSAPPEKEAKFRQSREKHGSVFAFHGSSIENWHSILRTGLKNASGTKLQVNGAAYGSGIYLSPQAATSFGYCRMYGYDQSVTASQKGNKFLDTANINCIAICEVIDKDIKKSGSIWVQPHPEHVVTRFFFVFTGQGTGNAQSCSTEDSNFRNEILAAIKSHS